MQQAFHFLFGRITRIRAQLFPVDLSVPRPSYWKSPASRVAHVTVRSLGPTTAHGQTLSRPAPERGSSAALPPAQPLRGTRDQSPEQR
ncbi:hypothetical protein GN956_G25212 [Arapaima gigas]